GHVIEHDVVALQGRRQGAGHLDLIFDEQDPQWSLRCAGPLSVAADHCGIVASPPCVSQNEKGPLAAALRLLWSGRRAQAAAARAAASSATAADWMMAAKRTAVCTEAVGRPASLSTFSCASMHMPQPLMAETARDHSSKSTLSTPGLPMTFMRSFAGRVPYSLFEARCTKR